ncbi:MAG: radical SAM protein [Proteobacteria bacterium]|nr:radical SAM protein [Pseudomonadota bacterium]
MGKFTFGPVPSRRLGFSLGVDIIPRKICTFDCIYCQIGKTTNQEIKRGSFFDAYEIVEEIINKAKQLSHIDHITFSGSGEPTLNSDIGWMIREIKKNLDVPVAVITNGSLLNDKEIRDNLSMADVVLPSLDAASEDIFRYINRPHTLIELSTIIEGMKKFRDTYTGNIWLEIMLIKNVNDSIEELGRLKKIVEYLGVEKVQLNTVIRPPTDNTIDGINHAELDRISKYFGYGCEVICNFEKEVKKNVEDNWSEMVLDILKRRPLTLNDIVKITGIPEHRVKSSLSLMEVEGKIKQFHFEDNIFYMIND